MKVVPRKPSAFRPSQRVKDGRRFLLKLSEEKKQMAHCPECDAEVALLNVMVGEIIYCADCNAELEVLNIEQPEVGLAPQVEEDWGE
jgi:alpha-aminoadipate/glutamate carrier protein LysW